MGYSEARARVAALASRLRAAGYGPGHRVAIALDNRPEFFLYFLALNSLGCSVVPLNAAMSVKELSFVLAHSDAALAVTHAGHAAHVRAALPQSVPLHVVAPLASAAQEDGTIPPAARPPAASPQEAALLYTSGTTGTPKGCILTNEYFLEIGRHYTGLGGYCRFDAAGDRLATPLPVTHMNALACSFMAMLMTGGCLIQLDRFHPTTWWQSLRTSRATAFHYLGVMPAMLLKAPQSVDDDFARRAALRLRRRGRSAPSRGVRDAIWSAADRSVGDDRDGGRSLDQPPITSLGTSGNAASARRPGVWPIDIVDDAEQRCRAGRGGRAAGQARRRRSAPRLLRGLLQGRAGNGAGVGRRLVSHRRSGAGRGGRLVFLR